MNGSIHKKFGFTIMELMVVLLLVALLASIVTPIVSKSIQRAKESTLKENLFVIRKALDDYYTDNASYPETLEILVDKRYIRLIPKDPIIEKHEWKLIDAKEGETGIMDIKSTSDAKGLDGTVFSEW